MKRWLQEYLGIADIVRNQQQLYNDHVWLHNKVDNIATRTERINTLVSALTPGISRIIAKLDPRVAQSEFDPSRKAESDRISEEVIKRLEAEAAAREPYNNV